MMSIKHFFGLAVLAAVTASCSSNDELVNNVSGSEASEGRIGYATFSINLPSSASVGTRAGVTRADDGGAEVAEGSAAEYAVKDASAIIFKKNTNSEGNTTTYDFVESVDLGNLLWESDATAGITTKATKVAKLSKVQDDGTYYALILLNNKKKDGTLKVSLPSSGNYASWNGTVLKDADFTANGFFMANAPLFTEGVPTTLVNIKSGTIYKTKEEAEKATNSTEVYVERAVAKVDVKTPGTNGVVEVEENGTKTGDKVTFKNWALDVTNKKTYAVHTYEGLTNTFADIWTTARFKGTNNRIYWAQDPNYSDGNLNIADAANDTKRKENFTYVSKDKVTAEFSTTTEIKPQYCLENTFDLDDMNQGQTTRVVFKSVYTPKTMKENATFYKVSKTIMNETDLKTTINKAAGEVLAGCTLVDNPSFLTTAGVHFLTCEDLKDASGNVLVAVTKYNGDTQTGDQVVAAINAKLGLSGYDGNTRPEDQEGIGTYLNGETYYIARIKHFGNDLTPWKSGETYGSNNTKYLGRYGVLRNNWYELSVGKVSGLGYPDIPPVKPTTPDDEDDKYISVSVKILDWAKRSQQVDL